MPQLFCDGIGITQARRDTSSRCALPLPRVFGGLPAPPPAQWHALAGVHQNGRAARQTAPRARGTSGGSFGLSTEDRTPIVGLLRPADRRPASSPRARGWPSPAGSRTMQSHFVILNTQCVIA